MDIRMPVLNGFEAYERLKYLGQNFPSSHKLPIPHLKIKKIMKMGFVIAQNHWIRKKYEVLDAVLLKFINKMQQI
jgi:CheY-like chemotaxis protein